MPTTHSVKGAHVCYVEVMSIYTIAYVKDDVLETDVRSTSGYKWSSWIHCGSFCLGWSQFSYDMA